MTDDRRLIEDYLPIGAISSESAREQASRENHIRTLHLWWARRPLVACRAAVYGALVPADRFRPENGPVEKRESLGRANAAKFVERLCRYPGDERVIREAERHILEAHAERLSAERGEAVTVEDIVEGRAPRPKVLDMFAGGGAIPLEALRLGCDAYALELNPVAHIIELCTLVYPQKYGKPDASERGSAPDGTWAGLAEEVRYWGNLVLEKVKAEIGDLYPPIPDPERPPSGLAPESQLAMQEGDLPGPRQPQLRTGQGWLTPVAYLWTRTVRCKNPSCGATVPLVRQTWLCKKPGRYAALRMVAPRAADRPYFDVAVATREADLGFDPAGLSQGGNATCAFCGTVADLEYAKREGSAGRMGQQLMAAICSRATEQGRTYVAGRCLSPLVSHLAGIEQRIEALCHEAGIDVPGEPLPPYGTLGFRVQPYGIRSWRDLFTPRQLLCLLTFVSALRSAEGRIRADGYCGERVRAIVTYLGLAVDRLADWNSSLCSWSPEGTGGAKIGHTFSRGALPMVWDFVESAVWSEATGSARLCLDWVLRGLEAAVGSERAAAVDRGSATGLPWPSEFFDAVLTDPPYYDNVPYADLSDFFYVWLKRTIGHLYVEHFSTVGAPKRQEIVAEPLRHSGSKTQANAAYEAMMASAFREAHRVLAPGAPMTVVYAHKTTLGWSTLVDALRQAGFVVSEAWPADTEMRTRLRGLASAPLASSIFLVARKRDSDRAGRYEEEVRPDLEQIVRERVDTLWGMGIAGADLVIAAVGAGLRAFTRFCRVEYANGEEVPADRFLAEVEGVVLETLLEKIFNAPRSGVAAVDGPSRFYVLWRYTYGAAPLDAGEAIVFTYAQPVELEGQKGLATGTRALVEKEKAKYRLRDFTERGMDERLGQPDANGRAAPLIDALHRILWLMENEPRNLPRFLDEAQPDRERLRLVAQALAGAGLEGNGQAGAQVITTPAEQSALRKLTANWRALVEQRAVASQPSLFDTRGQ